MIFAVAAVAVLAYGIWQSRDQGNSDTSNPPPAATPGAYRLIDIVAALEDVGFDKVEIIRSSFRSPQFSVPGQGVEVDGEPVYLFIYPGQRAVEAREAESRDLDLATMQVKTVSGTPIVEGEPHVVFNSNVIAVMPSTSQDVIDKVDEAIQGLS
jgi:hypothetical protein